jgi:hypothetical protein
MLSALLAAMVSVVGLGVTAQPAAAASAVSFCFREPTSPMGAVGAPYANKPVYLMRWAPWANKWVHERSGSTNASGCGTFFNTATAPYLRVQAYLPTRTGVFSAWTPRYANSGSGGANLGTGYLQFYRY